MRKRLAGRLLYADPLNTFFTTKQSMTKETYHAPVSTIRSPGWVRVVYNVLCQFGWLHYSHDRDL